MQQFVPVYQPQNGPPPHLQPAFPQLTSPVHVHPPPQAGPSQYHLLPGPPQALWQGEWEEDPREHEGGAEVSGESPSSPTTVPPPRTIDPSILSRPSSPNQKVKHRRRTTPDQLRVLEHWFGVNPKPDNNMREWLALELGMTKRNIQVWFQNRRAKVKNLALKERAARELRTPPKSAPAELHGNLSLQQQGPFNAHHHTHPQSYLSPPTMGRRVSLADGEAQKIQMMYGQVAPLRSPTAPKSSLRSMPYPSIPENAPASPKISPVGRSTSALHLTAINNSRRASVPSTHTVTSGPFTPPRVGAGPELHTDLSTAYITPPTSTYMQGFSPNAPLPSPGFSFGSPQDIPFDPAPGPWTWAPRGRIGSVASLNTTTTEGTGGSSEWESDWTQGVPAGFDPESRRASAPAELLQQLGVLGLNPNVHLSQMDAAQLNVSNLGPVPMESPNPMDPQTASGSGTSSSPHFVTPPFTIVQGRRHSTSPSPGQAPTHKFYDRPNPFDQAPGYSDIPNISISDRTVSAPMETPLAHASSAPDFRENPFEMAGFEPRKAKGPEVMTADQFFVDLGGVIDPRIMQPR